MSWKKSFLRSEQLPTHWTLNEQAAYWCFVNDVLAGKDEFAIVHDRKLIFFAARHVPPAKKFRMRAYAQAKKLARTGGQKGLVIINA